MTGLKDRGGVRERGERDARFFAWDVPGDAQIVALVHESGDAERSATVVDAIATSIARRREHTLLLSTDPGPSPLDELLGGSGSEGLPAALGGRARLIDVAIQRVDRPFVYLPAGKDLAAVRALLEDEVLASFVGRVRERGGTLFLVLSERTSLPESLCSLVDGVVVLGDVDVPKGADDLTVFGRVRFGDDDRGAIPSGSNGGSAAATAIEELQSGLVGSAAERIAAGTTAAQTMAAGTIAAGTTTAKTMDAAAPDSGKGDGLEGPDGVEVAAMSDLELGPDATDPEAGSASWARHRASREVPVTRIAAGSIVILGLFGAWWWFAGSGAPQGTSVPTRVARAEAATEPTPSGPGAAEIGRLLQTAPELPFSVLIASYADRADAEERLDDLIRRGRSEDAPYFTAPTPVRGVIYHRVFAGALPDEGAADALMQRLVAEGAKDEASAWHLRPARLAFDLGVFADEEPARARMSELAARGVPSYMLTTPLEGRPVFQLFGGAYENESAALPMAELLDRAGEPATLIARHAGAGPSPSP